MAAATGEAARQAVREGDLDAVRAFLDAGIDANLSNPATGRTLLHIACRQGFPAIASLLLSNGATAGAATLRHLTPLHLACHQGHLKVARLLLEAWAPVDDRDEAGTTPLHLCAQMGHGEVVRLLLQCGASKDARDESGWTPLFFACWKGNAAVARILLQAGANARASDGRNNITALHLACSWGHLEATKVMLEFGADSSAKDCNGAFPEGVIGAGSPDPVDPACARELSEVVVGHRVRIKDASSSLEGVVDSLRLKVGELEDQLERARRDRSELLAYSSEDNRRTFLAALKPECSVCQVEVKEAVLDPCRHLAACCLCASTLESCPLCSCSVRGYQLLESRQVYEHVLALEDELAGLRAQLQRFSRRVRDLVSENGDLKVELGRAKAINLVLDTERRSLEERFLVRSSLLPATSPVVETDPGIDRRSSAAAPRSAELEDGEDVLGRFGLGIERAAGDSVGGDGDLHGMGESGQQAGVADDRTQSGGMSLDEGKAVSLSVSGSRNLVGQPAGKDLVGSAKSHLPRSVESASADLEAGGDNELSKAVGGVQSVLHVVGSIPALGDCHREKAHDTDGYIASERSTYAGGVRPSPSDGTYDTSDISERDTPENRFALGASTAREQGRVAIALEEGKDGESNDKQGAEASIISRAAGSLSHNDGRGADAVRPGSDGHASPFGNDSSACETISGIWPSGEFVEAKVSAEEIGDDHHGLAMDSGPGAGAQEATDEIDRPPEQTASTGKPPPTTRRQHENSTHDPVNSFSTDSDQNSSSSCSPAG